MQTGGLEWQRKQRDLADTIRGTPLGGLGSGLAAVPQGKKTVSLTETETPDAPEGPRLIGSTEDLNLSASKMGLMTENPLMATATYNREALIEAIQAKQSQSGSKIGPPGSATAKDMSNGYMVPEGAKGLFTGPMLQNGILKPPMANSLLKPIHIGPWRMTETGEFKPIRSQLAGLAPGRGLGASVDFKQQALIEDISDTKEANLEPLGLTPLLHKDIETIVPPVSATFPTPEEPIHIQPALVPQVATQISPTLTESSPSQIEVLPPELPEPPEVPEPPEPTNPFANEGGGDGDSGDSGGGDGADGDSGDGDGGEGGDGGDNGDGGDGGGDE